MPAGCCFPPLYTYKQRGLRRQLLQCPRDSWRDTTSRILVSRQEAGVPPNLSAWPAAVPRTVRAQRRTRARFWPGWCRRTYETKSAAHRSSQASGTRIVVLATVVLVLLFPMALA